MFCSHCGSPVHTGDRYCASCGHLLHERRTLQSGFWYKLVTSLVLGVVLFMGWVTFSANSAMDTIESHLKAINGERITEAYYQHFSANFHQQTPLPAFRELISSIPALTKNAGVRCHECMINDNKAHIEGTLTSSDAKIIPVEYHLIKEDEKWKIDDMRFSIPSEESSQIAQAAAPGIGNPKIAAELFVPIDAQLKYFRANTIPKAYDETLSKEFKKATTLQAFTEFVKQYPILFKHKEVEVRQPTPTEERVAITVVLDPDSEAVPVDYILINEEGRWKIWSMVVSPQVWGSSEHLVRDLSTMKKRIELMFKDLQTKEIAKVYQEYASEAFQKNTTLEAFQDFLKDYPILTNFNVLEAQEPTFKKGTGQLNVQLKSLHGTALVEFMMGIEKGKWKIWGMKILRQDPNTERRTSFAGQQINTEAEDQSVVIPDSVPLEFYHIDIGTEMDLKGEVINPTSIVERNDREIRVNLFIRNGRRWTKVEVLMNHLESHSSIPAISTTLQQNGDTELSFVFTPPPEGWPRGHYEIVATSSTGVTKVFPFEIRSSESKRYRKPL